MLTFHGTTSPTNSPEWYSRVMHRSNYPIPYFDTIITLWSNLSVTVSETQWLSLSPKDSPPFDSCAVNAVYSQYWDPDEQVFVDLTFGGLVFHAVQSPEPDHGSNYDWHFRSAVFMARRPETRQSRENQVLYRMHRFRAHALLSMIGKR